MRQGEKPDLEVMVRRCAEILKRRREELGMTQRDLAAELGKNQAAVMKFEKYPMVNMQLRSLAETSYALGMPVSQLLQEAEGKTSTPSSAGQARELAALKKLVRKLHKTMAEFFESVEATEGGEE